MSESYQTYEWVMSHVGMAADMLGWVKVESSVVGRRGCNEAWDWRYVSQLDESCHSHTSEWGISHKRMRSRHANESNALGRRDCNQAWEWRFVSLVKESCHTSEGVMSRKWMSHVTHMWHDSSSICVSHIVSLRFVCDMTHCSYVWHDSSSACVTWRIQFVWHDSFTLLTYCQSQVYLYVDDESCHTYEQWVMSHILRKPETGIFFHLK